MENKNCILCKSEKLIKLHNYHCSHLVKCKSCSFVFSSKIPTETELTGIYTNYPRFYELSPITIKRYNELLDKFEPYKKTGNLLDLGCSNGLFLECAKKRGWNVYGTEFANESIEFCAKNQIKVFKSDQLPQEFFNLQFDVITSFEVIEHLNTPNEELELVNKVLRKGGLFYLTTPNFNALSRHILKEKWNVIDYPEHLSYYTPKTIHFLLNKFGFKKKYILTSGISFARFNQSTGKQNTDNAAPINDEALRDKIERNKFLSLSKSIINSLLNLFKIGDSLKALYIKD